jgi:serine/threonine-protein kinase RIO1
MAKEWTEEEIRKLKRLRELGASLARACVALKRGKAAVRLKAKELGIPFPHLSTIRRERNAKEAVARGRAGLPPKPI